MAQSDTQTQVHSSAGGATRVAQLHVVHGPTQPLAEPVPLGAEPVVIGREGEGIAVDDGEVSRRHARIEADPNGGWRVTDLESRNGTFADGVRVEGSKRIVHGSVVRVGRTLILLVDVELPSHVKLRRETPLLRGHGIAMQVLRGEIAAAAKRDSPVLVLGETGAGKECVARELHERSGRKGEFVPVNCAALPGNLAESELFGHTAGAFTGAAKAATGLFAAAEGGTLFLDEIGELDPAVQPKLLRALAIGEVRQVGTTAPRQVDVRVVAATHVDLVRRVDEGGFRADLYARLAGIVVHVPPLRDHREDVLRLARVALDRERTKIALSAGAAEALLLHEWPYNVRELEQVLAAAAGKAGAAGVIRTEHLPDLIAAPVLARNPRGDSTLPLAAAVPARPAAPAAPAAPPPSAEELAELMRKLGGNVVKVAEALGKDRRQIYRWLRRHKLLPEDFREE